MAFSSESQPVRDITVKILLTGGQEYTVILKSDSLILRSLFQAVGLLSKWEGNPLAKVFEIPIDKGRASLCFPREHLIGLVTDPPVTVNKVQSSFYLHFPNFLTSEEKENLLDYTLKIAPSFQVSAVTTGIDSGYRKSSILPFFSEICKTIEVYKVINDRIEAMIPYVLNKLDIPVFSFSMESQLTASNDGDFFKIHNDHHGSRIANRELTYVYYFYREPKGFSGGEMRMYDSTIENNFCVAADTFKTIEPQNNSIIFFLSHYLHEVLPVSCPSKNFADSRFTINGWVRRR